jgi:hypothetical protein
MSSLEGELDRDRMRLVLGGARAAGHAVEGPIEPVAPVGARAAGHAVEGPIEPVAPVGSRFADGGATQTPLKCSTPQRSFIR